MDRVIEISAVIPTYNRKGRVERAVRSVLAQTRTVEEIIVVDDGSTDGTAASLEATFGNRVRVIRQANRGVSAARNRGLREAAGRYLALLDSDDEWSPDKMRLQHEWLQARPDFGMVLCDYDRIEAGLSEPRTVSRREAIPLDGLVLEHVLRQPSLAPSTAMIRREVFERVGGFDEALRTAEDVDFHIRVAARWPIGVIEQVLMRAHMEETGLSALERSYDDYVLVMERAVSALERSVPERTRGRALSQAYARTARGMVVIGRYRRAWEMARRAWSVSPDGPWRLGLLGLPILALRRASALGLRSARRRGP